MVYKYRIAFQNMSGLDNLGNTCYMNSVVQMLRYVKPVVLNLVKVKPENDGINHFIDLLYQGSTPQEFAYCLKDFGFDPIYQHDAHEFLLTMLDKLYECIDEKNPFEGKSTTVLRCKNGHTSTRVDPFVCLSINGGIEDGIPGMVEPEEVQCKCEQCDEKTMTKTIDLDPNDVVCVHFKRFNMDRKLRYKVPILQKWNGYELVGICNHVGGLHGGHYTATVRTDNGWLHINDDHVKKMDGLPQESNVPYIMVYVRH